MSAKKVSTSRKTTSATRVSSASKKPDMPPGRAPASHDKTTIDTIAEIMQRLLSKYNVASGIAYAGVRVGLDMSELDYEITRQKIMIAEFDNDLNMIQEKLKTKLDEGERKSLGNDIDLYKKKIARAQGIIDKKKQLPTLRRAFHFGIQMISRWMVSETLNFFQPDAEYATVVVPIGTGVLNAVGTNILKMDREPFYWTMIISAISDVASNPIASIMNY